MFSFLLSNAFKKVGSVLVVLLVIAYTIHYINNIKEENYKLHTKIKQMEAIFNQCQNEKRIYELYCATKQDIEAIGVDDVKIKDKNNSNSVIFDFSRL